MASDEELDYEAALKGGREILAQRGIAGPTLITVAASGLVVQIWRDTIEPLHRLFNDAEMSRMSMVTTRDIVPLITEDSVDVTGITEVLQDGRRPLIGDQTAARLLGRHWRYVRTEIGRRMEERSFHPISLALWGNMVAHDWWGNPRYAELVSLLCADLPDEIPCWDEQPNLLEDKLLQSPWEIPLETWAWCLKRGLAWDYRPAAREASLTPLNQATA